MIFYVPHSDLAGTRPAAATTALNHCRAAELTDQTIVTGYPAFLADTSPDPAAAGISHTEKNPLFIKP